MSESSKTVSVHPLPAHQTKHFSRLSYRLPNGTLAAIEQDGAGATANQDESSSTGRTIWLGGQILAAYLAGLPGKGATRRTKGRRPVVIDVGSGTGLLALALASEGFDVIATDVHLLAGAQDGLLRRNIANNVHLWPSSTVQQPPRIEARVLDWMSNPETWDFSIQRITPARAGSESIPNQSEPLCKANDVSPSDSQSFLGPPFDLITSSDSVYAHELNQPLLRTIHALATSNGASSSSTSPPVYLAIEVRDPALVQRFLQSARDDYGFKCAKVDNARIEAVIRPWGWEKSEWDGIEVWKLGLSRKGSSKMPKGG